MSYTVVVMGAGADVGNNLIRSLRQSSLELDILGTNCSPRSVAKSHAERTELLPRCDESGYASSVRALCNEEEVDLLIPNNDSEARKIAEIEQNSSLPCQTFLPSHDEFVRCQDKQNLHEELEEHDIPTADAVPLSDLGDLDTIPEELSESDQYWVRLRTGAGSIGATRVKNMNQARNWIRLWCDLRDFSVEDFHVSEYLPGRDYACQSLWYEGELVLLKLCERLLYVGGSKRLSGTSSTPSLARTRTDEAALQTARDAVRAASERPHGIYPIDMKADQNGVMNVTEFNIGRFFCITPIFDQTGEENTADLYLKCALNEESTSIRKKIDIEPDHYLLREMDTEPLVLSRDQLEQRWSHSRGVRVEFDNHQPIPRSLQEEDSETRE